MRKIKMVLTDVDGCLTDGTIYYGENHQKFKRFDMKDGMGFTLLKESNVLTGIISNDNSDATKYRAQDLKIDAIYIGVQSKIDALYQIVNKYKLELDEIAFMGDDILDLEVLEKVGISFAPNNAIDKVKYKVDHITKASGGEGAFREYAEYILELNGGIK